MDKEATSVAASAGARRVSDRGERLQMYLRTSVGHSEKRPRAKATSHMSCSDGGAEGVTGRFPLFPLSLCSYPYADC